MLRVGTQLEAVDKWTADSAPNGIPLGPRDKLAISPSGRFIANANQQQGLVLIDLLNKTTKTILASEHQRFSVPIDPRSGFQQRMRVETSGLSTDDNFYYFTPDERKLFANVHLVRPVNGERRILVVYDLEANRISASLACEETAAVTPAGDWCITSDTNNTYHWSLQEGVPAQFAFTQSRSRANSIVVSGGRTVSAWAGKEGLRIDIHELPNVGQHVTRQSRDR